MEPCKVCDGFPKFYLLDPKVVDTYRSARAIAVRDQKGEASTEDLRKAVVYYRALFDELLEARHPAAPPKITHSNEVMQS